MKGLIIWLLCLASGWAQSGRSTFERSTDLGEEVLPNGAELMRQVQAQLPPMPLRLTGTIRTRQGKVQQDRRLVTTMRFGDPVPSVRYEISDNFGDLLTEVQVSWPRGAPVYAQWDADGEALPPPEAFDEVLDTGLTWSDLALDFLWWEGAQVLERDRVKNRSAVVVLIPAPPEIGQIKEAKLWVDERALFIVKAELRDETGNLLKRMEVDSLKKVRDDFWMVKDVVLVDQVAKRRMGIRFQEVEELENVSAEEIRK